MSILNTLVGIIAGFFGSIGVGGGSVLILYLTLFLSTPQLQAQGINLLFFIPCSAVGIAFHIKHKLIDYKTAAVLIVFGLCGVAAGFLLTQKLDESVIKKLFGAFLLLLATYQIIGVIKEKKSRD